MFINNSSPSVNIDLFLKSIESLMNVYSEISKSKNCILLVNTFGWVEGLGSMILFDATKIIKPEIIVTLSKGTQG